VTKLVDSAFLGSSSPFPLTVPVPAGSGFAFSIANGPGMDILDLLGDTTFGAGISPPAAGPAVTIANAGGGSATTFGPEASQLTERVKVYGGLQVSNGGNLQGILDVVSFDNTDVTGAVLINNDGGPGGSSVLVTDSNLGTNLLPAGPAPGNPVVVASDAGPDSFVAANLNAPWGLFVTNVVTVGPVVDVAGSTATITDSKLGMRPGGPTSGLAGVVPALPAPILAAFAFAGVAAGDALLVQGDQGQDLLTVTETLSEGRRSVACCELSCTAGRTGSI